MSKAASTTATFSSRTEPLAASKDNNLLSFLETALGPLTLVASLWALAFYFDGDIDPPYLLLATLAFALTFPSQARLHASSGSVAFDIALNWAWVAGLLFITGYATGYIRYFSTDILQAWVWVAPLSEIGACMLLRSAAPALLRLQGPKERALIVGMNDQGVALASKLSDTPYSRIELAGFVDSRSPDRLPLNNPHPVVGQFEQIANLVKQYQIQVIYLSLPMASQPRILQILDELKDTTASIYFVPDMFVTDLIQSNTASVYGTPVISVCETPFKGTNGFIKRASDIFFSLAILILIFPVLIIIGVAVKLGSPGPMIFKQRRYGLDGEEILVYKFRSMSVTEDGGAIRQAQKNDSRITPLGAFLRKSSLDELPQFINVLQGRMSIVGPRPHAVAHNELYRKLIKGYMVRHKVKPGITGWAQVNGYRGETDTLDKMQGRIDYDLDYLRNWSLRLDTFIILKTVRLVAKDQKAY
jgi:putative colanic acid biosysnthesis UDP-glucose lipid carrier transferase